jgi:hypothetical protein
MTLSRAGAALFAATTLFAAPVLVPAAPASADQPIAGIYTYKQAGIPQERWTVYPTCLPAGCILHISGEVPGKGMDSDSPPYAGDARLVNGQWTLPISTPDGIKCPDGTTAASSNLYSFDDQTLTGTNTVIHGWVCGLKPTLTKVPFTLTYESPLPVPVELYPVGCPTWPHCDQNTIIPGQLSPPPPPPS